MLENKGFYKNDKFYILNINFFIKCEENKEF